MATHEVLPAVHRVFSLVKRWLMGTMQGSVSPEHMQAYFDEWVFRFNRRNSLNRGLPFHTLLLNAVQDQPVTYESLCKTGRTRPTPPPPSGSRQLPPASTWNAPNDHGVLEIPRRNALSRGTDLANLVMRWPVEAHGNDHYRDAAATATR